MKNYLISFLLFTSISLCQSTSLLTNIEGRKTYSLNGYWKIIIDPFENGYYNYRYQPNENGFFKNQKPKSESDLVEYDFDKSDSLLVPGDWNTQQEKLLLYEGTIWYKKSFNLKDKLKDKKKKFFIHFGAINYKVIVYLNGNKLGEHEGGFTPFNFEVTNHLKEKDNFVVVKVDNKRSREFVPTVNTDWWNYGGITRDVTLIEVPSTYIKDYFIQLNKNSDDEISGWVKLDGEDKLQTIKIKIPELKVEYNSETDENGFCNFKIECKPVLWSPENPKLYNVEIISKTDSVNEKIGFRRIEIKDGEILINGKPVFLRGISAHEEAPEKGGRANSKEDASTILKWVKELNGNFIRLAHYPHNENIVRLADEKGIFVWSEIPVYWTILWDNKSTFNNALNQLEEMIARDKNRVSIILWSVANETPLSKERLVFLSRLVKRTKELDSTRLITAALENHYINDSTIIIDDPFGEHLDVIGLNEYLGWYDGLPDKIDKINYQIKYNKPVIISEFGAGALQGLHGDSLSRWTEEYQANVYEHQIKLMKRIPNLSGMTPWILADFRSPRRQLPGIQDFWNRKGLISDKGIKKKAFNILSNFYLGILNNGW